jgi:hypothetical protein
MPRQQPVDGLDRDGTWMQRDSTKQPPEIARIRGYDDAVIGIGITHDTVIAKALQSDEARVNNIG